MRRRRASLVALGALLAQACGTPPPPTAPSGPPAASRDAVERPLPRVPERVPTEASAPVTGEVPAALLAAMIADAAALTGVRPADIVVTRAESVTWSDGALGCARPGEFYTQALVPGYRVELSAGGRDLDYRADDRGNFRRCEATKEKGLPLTREAP